MPQHQGSSGQKHLSLYGTDTSWFATPLPLRGGQTHNVPAPPQCQVEVYQSLELRLPRSSSNCPDSLLAARGYPFFFKVPGGWWVVKVIRCSTKYVPSFVLCDNSKVAGDVADKTSDFTTRSTIVLVIDDQPSCSSRLSVTDGTGSSLKLIEALPFL